MLKVTRFGVIVVYAVFALSHLVAVIKIKGCKNAATYAWNVVALFVRGRELTVLPFNFFNDLLQQQSFVVFAAMQRKCEGHNFQIPIKFEIRYEESGARSALGGIRRVGLDP